MTVRELINKLKEFSLDEEIALGFSDEEDDVETVELVDEIRTSRLTGEKIHCRWVRIGP